MTVSQKVPIAKIKRDPNQPRKEFKEAVIVGLSESLKLRQFVPILVYRDGEHYVLVDGECRTRAALLAGIPELDAVVLPTKPSPEGLAVAQATIDVHRSSLNAIERSDQLARIQQLTGCTVTELAAKVSISQPMASKLMALQRLSPEVQAKVAAGELDVEKAVIVAAQAADPVTQASLVAQAATMSREQLRQKLRRSPEPFKAKTALARFPLSAGLTVTVQGSEVTLEGAIEALSDAIKELKRGLAQGVGIGAMQKVMKDKAKSAKC